MFIHNFDAKMSVVLHNLHGNTIDSNTTDKQVTMFSIK